MKITLPIYYNTDETSNASGAGVEVPLKEYIVKDMFFYNIDAISDFENVRTGEMCTEIHCGDRSFICPLPKEEVDAKITSYRLN